MTRSMPVSSRLRNGARALASASVLLALLAPSPARAAEPSPDFRKEPVETQYPAPLSQATQPSYVPQSVALSGPREIDDYKDGDAVPPGYRPVERMRKGLVIGGAVTFGSLYSLSMLTAAAGADASPSSKTNPVAALWIPCLGPFIQMASTDGSTGKLVLAMDGIGQSLGMTMLIVGLTTPKTVLVRSDLVGEAPKPTVRVVPLVGKSGSGTGMSVVGTF